MSNCLKCGKPLDNTDNELCDACIEAMTAEPEEAQEAAADLSAVTEDTANEAADTLSEAKGDDGSEAEDTEPQPVTEVSRAVAGLFGMDVEKAEKPKVEKKSRKAIKAEQKAAEKAEKQANKKALEKQEEKEDKRKQKDNTELLSSPALGKGGVAFIILLCLALIAAAVNFLVLPLVKSKQQQEIDQQQAYLTLLCGSWLSEPFTYASNEGGYPVREMFVLADDYSYQIKNYTSPSDRDSFDITSWSVTESQQGSFMVEPETASLRLYFEQNGSTLVYRRYVRSVEANALVLREYYNAEMTDYYDVVFTRYEG